MIEPSRSLRSFREGNDTWLLVGGEGHLTGSEEAQPERYAALERFAREHFDHADRPTLVIHRPSDDHPG